MADDLTQVTVQVTTETASFEAGTVPGDWDIRVLDAESARVLDYKGPNTFASGELGPGDYVAKGNRLDAGGAVLGSVQETTFRVDSSLVEILVAGGISVSQN